jgi:hypothetical protein
MSGRIPICATSFPTDLKNGDHLGTTAVQGGQGTGPAVTGTEYVVYIENVDENSGSKTPSVAGRVEGSLKLVEYRLRIRCLSQPGLSLGPFCILLGRRDLLAVAAEQFGPSAVDQAKAATGGEREVL